MANGPVTYHPWAKTHLSHIAQDTQALSFVWLPCWFKKLNTQALSMVWLP